nr:RNA-directed DNA polymerase, eukaryota, reverse transcriptase zinc-binding domain protein [Tanacetum cinerariifolium]
MNVDNSSSGTTYVIDKIRKFKDLLTSRQVIFVDKAGDPLTKVEFMGFGTQSLLEQWWDSYGNGNYDDDLFDDDMYEVRVFDVERLVGNLCTMWIGRHKIHDNVDRFQIASLNNSSNQFRYNEENGTNINDVSKDKGIKDSANSYDHDYSRCLMGKVKDFVSLSNLKEEGCFHRIRVCISTTGTSNIFESFKLVYQGEPNGDDLRNGEDLEGDNDIDAVPDTMFEEKSPKTNGGEAFVGQNEVRSEDPFNIYDLLNKKKEDNKNGSNAADSLKYPSGITPREDVEQSNQKNRSVRESGEGIRSTHEEGKVSEAMKSDSKKIIKERCYKISGVDGFKVAFDLHGFGYYEWESHGGISIFKGMFKGIALVPSMQISHMFYADDANFVGQWSDSNIDTIVHVLDCFYRASGLCINISKRNLMRISVDEEKVDQAASNIGCTTLNAPFSYLGLKVGGLMSRIQSWNDIVDSMVVRLSKWKMKTLSIGGRLMLLKYPRSYTLESCKSIDVAAKLAHTSMDYSFWRVPRCGVEQTQFADLLIKVEGVSLVNMNDRLVWSFEGSSDFLVALVRKLIDDKRLPKVSSKTRWIKEVPIKVNVHA